MYKLRIFGKALLVLILFGLDLVLIIQPFYNFESEDLGGGYQIFEGGERHISGPEITIPPEILNYSVDDRFIIVKQRLEGNLGRIYTDFHGYNYPYLYCTYYWIIDKEEDTYYGPLFYEQYKEKSDSLNVGLAFDKNNEKTLLEFSND